MEAKLKTLRVADLRELLQKASVPIPPKANKADLIAKVLASPAALQTFDNQGSTTAKPKAPESSQGGQEDDLLAPPEEFDWGSASPANRATVPSTSTVEVAATPAVKSTNIKAPAQPEKKSATVPTAPTVGANTGKVEEELEKRKKRAARFGVPLVETKAKAPTASSAAKASPRSAKPTAEDTTKLDARAARFGMPTASTKNPPVGGQKRARSPAPIDKEEIERRKKRAERFATSVETQLKA